MRKLTGATVGYPSLNIWKRIESSLRLVLTRQI